MKRKIFLALFAFSFAFAATSHAAVKTKTVSYEYGGTTLKGYLAWDDSLTGKRPGVLVVHDFWGLNDYAKRRAEQLAGLGYVAFAADMYGDGKVGAHPDEARAMMAAVKKNLETWRGRAKAALATLKAQPNVDAARLAAIGYCFGGGTVLQLAYIGADLKAVVSFHGALSVPDSTKDIPKTMKLLILQGADDPYVTAETIQKLKAALEAGQVDYKFIAYPGAVHSFTVKEAGDDPKTGAAYNAQADKKSWEEMLKLFGDIFK